MHQPCWPSSCLRKLDLLILDEVGFVPFPKAGAELLFGLLTDRYERGSVLVTTNLDFAISLPVISTWSTGTF